jgi:hypothetical protein
MVCMAALFCLQYEVLSSPKASMSIYTHPIIYKSDTFYLAEPLFSFWTVLNFVVLPLWAVAFLLIVANNTFEHRIKQRLWDAGLGELVEHTKDGA